LTLKPDDSFSIVVDILRVVIVRFRQASKAVML
jgi:hypothetical protein